MQSFYLQKPSQVIISADHCITLEKYTLDKYFFLFLHENICCWYSLEAPQWDVSNEYP